MLLTFTVFFGGGAVCSAESAGTSFPFFTDEINRMIDENYKLVQENGWAELRIPESVHGLSRDIFSPNAVDAAEKLINAGYEAYCIGGAVRDLVMGTPTMDFDIVTTAPNEEFEKILGDVTFHTIPSGQSFGYAHYPDEVIDVARCVNIPAAYKGLPGVPDFDPDALYSGSFVADSFQRDLTFNAIYYDFRTGDLVDYHGGLHDIREGIVDTMVDPYVAIDDDPRIAIRSLRFAARYNFRLSDRMDAAMMENGPEYAAKNKPDRNEFNLAKYYDAGYARRCLDNLEKYNMFTAIYTPAAELYQTDAYKEYIRAATDWMDEWYAAGKVMDGNLSIAAFLWPAVEELKGEALQTAAKELFAAQRKTIEINEEKEAKFLDIYDLQAKLTGELTEEDSQELLQHPHFMDAFELLMIRSRTNPELNPSVKYWSELMQKNRNAATRCPCIV
jgi:poly(A) polymerase